MKQAFFFLLVCIFCGSVKASHGGQTPIIDTLTLTELETGELFFSLEHDSTELETKPVKFKRGKAIIFTILTGLLGGHRIYLGTHHRTPIIYSVTLGGLGILPLVDLINLIFTKDISKFEDKSQIIMWGK